MSSISISKWTNGIGIGQKKNEGKKAYQPGGHERTFHPSCLSFDAGKGVFSFKTVLNDHQFMTNGLKNDFMLFFATSRLDLISPSGWQTRRDVWAVPKISRVGFSLIKNFSI